MDFGCSKIGLLLSILRHVLLDFARHMVLRFRWLSFGVFRVTHVGLLGPVGVATVEGVKGIHLIFLQPNCVF
jgi:hypothetical protein